MWGEGSLGGPLRGGAGTAMADSLFFNSLASSEEMGGGALRRLGGNACTFSSCTPPPLIGRWHQLTPSLRGSAQFNGLAPPDSTSPTVNQALLSVCRGLFGVIWRDSVAQNESTLVQLASCSTWWWTPQGGVPPPPTPSSPVPHAQTPPLSIPTWLLI